MIVCGFMIRLSPFTEIFLALQVSLSISASMSHPLTYLSGRQF
jgi:hypothetical protein